jgi:hypothetical protein
MISKQRLFQRDPIGPSASSASLDGEAYQKHIRPIGKMFLRAFRDRERHDLAEKVLDWMRKQRSTARRQSLSEGGRRFLHHRVL